MLLVDGAEALSGLAWWAGPGQDFMEGLGEAGGRPNFPEAARALCANMLLLAVAHTGLGAVFKDAGRYVAAMWAFHLDETEGLTLARLKEVCGRSALLSPGRARALLQFLQHLGYAERLAGPPRAAAWRLTDAFRRDWALQLRASLEAGRILEPQMGLILEAKDEAALWTYGRLHAEGLFQAATDEPLPAPLAAFMHAHAGNQILWTLLASGEADAFPPALAGPVSVSALARRFKVSRIHVHRIFERTAREDVASLGPDGHVRFNEAAREILRWIYAAQLAQILAAAGRAAQVHGLKARVKNVQL